jgi:hypothetical protein
MTSSYRSTLRRAMCHRLPACIHSHHGAIFTPRKSSPPPHPHGARFVIPVARPRFFRVYPKPLVSSYPPFSINRMTDPNHCDTSVDQPNRLQASARRKRSHWLRCMVASAAMLAVGLLVFDWYFFFVVDRLSSTLRPIVAVLHQASGDRRARALPSSSGQQPAGDRSLSPTAPVRSAACPNTPPNWYEI